MTDTQAPQRSLLLGVDTGGTYTDAVLLDATDHTMIGSAKALTTRDDLAIGVTNAITAIMGDVEPTEVSLVSVSTTLATNAVVEGHGSPVLALLVGFDEKMIERSGIRSAFGDVLVESVAGGHDHYGNEASPLDTDTIEALIEQHGDGVRAVAVAGAFAVRNPAHEYAVRDMVLSRTELPVTVSSTLSASLDAPRRALTTALNARLLSRITDLVEAVERTLVALDIDAPVLIAKGDGSLAVAETVARRPIETVLSGPAASLVGARTLCGLDDFLLSDIGGTTTDVGQVLGGRPQLAPQGATVGGWRTMVQAIDIRTIGLGGDSEVHTERAAVTVGPQRRIPLSLLGVDFASVGKRLRRDLHDPPPRDIAAVFVVAASEDGRAPTTSGIEDRILDRLEVGVPTALADVAIGTVERRSVRSMADRGLLRIAGFAPSDASHVLGLQENWSTETASDAAALMAWYTGLDVEDFCRSVWSETVRQSCGAILEVALGGVDSPLSNVAYDAASSGVGQVGRVSVQLRPVDPVVAVGGPAPVYYPEVAKRLEAELLLPVGCEVANAIGAATGQLLARATAEVQTDGPGLFRIVSTHGVATATDAAAAIAAAEAAALEIAHAELARLAEGLEEIGAAASHIEIDRFDDPNAEADEGLYSANISVELSAKPLSLSGLLPDVSG